MIRFLSGLVVVLMCGNLLAAEPAATPKLIPASDEEAISLAINSVATIEGRVERIGTTEKKGITFLNFSKKRGGFVAIVFMSAYGQFPDGFDKFRGKVVRVTGKVEVYSEAVAQIVIKKADQIEIVESPSAAN